MAMLTIYFSLNVTLNYSSLHILMLKGSLDEKNSKFFFKNKTYPVAWDQQSPKNYRFFRSLCFESRKHFAAKTKLDTSSRSLQRPKMKKWWLNNAFSWENIRIS